MHDSQKVRAWKYKLSCLHIVLQSFDHINFFYNCSTQTLE